MQKWIKSGSCRNRYETGDNLAGAMVLHVASTTMDGMVIEARWDAYIIIDTKEEDFAVFGRRCDAKRWCGRMLAEFAAAKHTESLKEIERLWDSKPDTPDGDKLNALAHAVDAYERQHFAIPGVRS
jgi:hypothetical protein